MITYDFKCQDCKNEFEKFRLGIKNLELWKKGQYSIACPICKSQDIKLIIPKGSGQFKEIKWR